MLELTLRVPGVDGVLLLLVVLALGRDAASLPFTGALPGRAVFRTAMAEVACFPVLGDTSASEAYLSGMYLVPPDDFFPFDTGARPPSTALGFNLAEWLRVMELDADLLVDFPGDLAVAASLLLPSCLLRPPLPALLFPAFPPPVEFPDFLFPGL